MKDCPLLPPAAASSSPSVASRPSVAPFSVSCLSIKQMQHMDVQLQHSSEDCLGRRAERAGQGRAEQGTEFRNRSLQTHCKPTAAAPLGDLASSAFS